MGVFLYVLVVNLIAYIMMILDKRAARLQRRRIPEARMLWIAFLGGALGMWIGMKHIRHKTQKRTFVLGIPFLVVVNGLMISIGLYVWS